MKTKVFGDHMNRRELGQRMASALVGGAVLTSEAMSHDTLAVDSVPFKLSVMLWTIYKSLPFEQRLERVAQAGYHAVELVDEFKNWSSNDFQKANARKRSLDISFDATAGMSKSLVDPQQRDAFLAELQAFLSTAAQLECPAIIALSGNLVPNLSRQQQHESCIEGLKRAADLAAKRNIKLFLENIDPEENPKYYLTSVAEGFEIVRKVDNPHVRFLYDLYHEQIAEGNLIEKLEKNIELVGLLHVADVPGRHAPGTGEINYQNVFRKLSQLQYDRYIAMEFVPVADPIAELKGARELAIASARHN
jgi:hydroxypyruvate isomerase